MVLQTISRTSKTRPMTLPAVSRTRRVRSLLSNKVSTIIYDMSCLKCGSETSNPKFCSLSCSASYNNTLFKRRTFEGSCRECGTSIPSKWKYCLEHKNPLKERWIDKTLNSNAGSGATVRAMARTVYAKSGRPMSCAICKYSTHVDICHVRDIRSHPHGTSFSIINSLGNLIALCKNHHWEFDHDILLSAHSRTRTYSLWFRKPAYCPFYHMSMTFGGKEADPLPGALSGTIPVLERQQRDHCHDGDESYPQEQVQLIPRSGYLMCHCDHFCLLCSRNSGFPGCIHGSIPRTAASRASSCGIRSGEC